MKSEAEPSDWRAGADGKMTEVLRRLSLRVLLGTLVVYVFNLDWENTPGPLGAMI